MIKGPEEHYIYASARQEDWHTQLQPGGAAGAGIGNGGVEKHTYLCMYIVNRPIIPMAMNV